MKINGKELRVTPAPFEDAIELQDAFGRALMSSPLKFDIEGLDKENLMESNISEENLGSIVKGLISVVISKDLRKALFKCAERAILDQENISYDFFEEVENRSLFYPIMVEVAKVNLLPFFKNLFSKSGDLLKTIKNFLK
jgi:hypothetical protein